MFHLQQMLHIGVPVKQFNYIGTIAPPTATLNTMLTLNSTLLLKDLRVKLHLLKMSH